MKITPKQYAQALYEITQTASSHDANIAIENFVQYLGKRGVLSRANQIISEFIKYYNFQEGIIGVEASSAREFSSDEKKDIVSSFEKITGKKIELHQKIDKEVLGGVIFKIQDTIIDASLKTQLIHLHKQLTQ